MKAPIVAALCAALLAGCSAHNDGASDDATCRAKGLTAGSQEYVRCRETLFNARAATGGTYSPAAVIPLEGPIGNSCSTSGNVTSCHEQ
jgi:hypothetical protein